MLTRIFNRILLAPIRWYQRWLSPLKRQPTCRYLPTCSEYAALAIEQHGPARGSLMAVGRVLRCNPLFHGGYHPVESRRDCEGH
jgi:putative membrane protein insertion efficiency factor